MPNISDSKSRYCVRRLAPIPAILLILFTLVGSPSAQVTSKQRSEGTPSRAQYPTFISPIAPVDIPLRISDEYMPVLGVWVWRNENLAPEGFRKPIEQAAMHSPFNLLIAFLRFPDKEVVDADYKKDLATQMWSSALAGGRINYLSFQSLSSRELLLAESRIRLLNYITQSPLDCPVAVIFGHAAAMNWAGPYFNDVGMELVDSLWKEGYAADLIPTSEIENGSLRVDEKGLVRYGDQTYAAVVLYHPEFERKDIARFFQKADRGNTELLRVGKWTRDFDGQPVDGDSLLPKSMPDMGEPAKAQASLLAVLGKKQVPRQTAATAVLDNTFFELRDFESKSCAPRQRGTAA
ncbi:MAG: hypothetical protein JXA73_08225 [Acidobacteria bacterium]|nr:hypothetical protein [Acidobacteriota bacterium]